MKPNAHDGAALFFTVTAAKGEDERRSLPERVIRKRGIFAENSILLAESGGSRGIINLTDLLVCGDEAIVEAIRSRVDRWTDRRPVKATLVSPELYGRHSDEVGPSIHPVYPRRAIEIDC